MSATGAPSFVDAPPAGDDGARAVARTLERLYGEIAERSMRDLPVYNPALEVAAIGFARRGDRIVGVLTTPWFMNLVVAAPPEGPPLAAADVGATVVHVLPGGDFPCTVGRIDGFGRLDSASLFSPMNAFEDADTVRAVAEAAIAEILAPPVVAEPPAVPPPEPVRLDRRALLFGRGRSEGARPCP